jgi:hypothetical protein
MNYSIFDIETDGLIDNVTKIHCMSVLKVVDGQATEFTLTSPGTIEMFLNTENILIGHNIIRYDIPVLEKLLGIKINARLIDTLTLSWYLYPERKIHNLEEWGEFFGVEKPKISDWSNLTVEEYSYRCQEDVKINTLLFNKQIEYLMTLYENDSSEVNRFMSYLMWKMDCAREQEEMRWPLDVEKCQKNLTFLEEEKQKKIDILTTVMPKKIKYKDVPRPNKLVKQDGSLSVAGEKWLALLKSQDLPEYHVGTVRVVEKEEAGNPTSHAQLKEWLFSIGWVPITFKHVPVDSFNPKARYIDSEGRPRAKETRKVPQLAKDDGSGSICDSVKKLYEQVPELENLEGLFVIQHRIGILKGFLEHKSEDNHLRAEIKGLTNTLRFQHTTIVNLPTIHKPYGDVVRGCLIAPKGMILCGSDMASLEDRTKQHYMFFFDPAYVEEMRKPDFDPHLDIALEAKLVTIDDVTFYKLFNKEVAEKTDKERYNNIKDVRNNKAKKVNFGAVYGAGPPKLALTGGFPLSLAKLLHTVYWKRNWSVKKVSDSCKIKTINQQMWLHNPVSGFWYSLRFEKDKFSTLNQGTGVYCFDTQVKNVRKHGIKMCGQFHDEFIFPLLESDKERCATILDNAIIDTNEQLNLNVKLSISKDFGLNYAEIH